jgi:WXG100 family type VII secretion target
MATMNYEYSQIDAMAQQLKQYADHIEQRLAGDVEKQYNGLVQTGDFVGQASDAFMTAKTAWKSAIKDMQETLSAVHRAAMESATDMNGADRDMMKLFD